MLNHACCLKGSDYRVVLGSFSEGGKPPEFITQAAAMGLETSVIPVSNAYDPRAAAKLKRLLDDNDASLLCTHDYRSHLIGHAVRLRSNRPHLCFARGYTQDDLKVRLYQMMDHRLMHRADHVVAVSQQLALALKSRRLKSDRITVVHNAVDPVQWDGVAPADVRRRFGFNQDTQIVLTAGRFSQEKGQRFFVRAAAKMLRTHPRLRFVLFGDGPDLDAVRALASDLGVSQAVLCPGFERDIVAVMKGADLLVNPSQSEGLPNVVLEAMAVGLPVVATAVGGVPEVITSGHDGLLVEYGDIDRMAEAVIKLTLDDDARKRFVAAARQTLVERFSFAQQAERLKDVYRKVTRRD